MKRLPSLLAASVFALSLAACHSADADKNAAAVTAQEVTIDSMKMEIAKQRIVDSMQRVAALAKEDADLTAAAAAAALPLVAAPAAKAPNKAVTRKRSTKRSTPKQPDYNNNSTYANGNGGYSSPAPVYNEPAPVPAKRGWSAKAKGAVIGAGAGAVGGAIINKKNRGVGAIIGGVGGAILGTGVGAVIDRKNGR